MYNDRPNDMQQHVLKNPNITHIAAHRWTYTWLHIDLNSCLWRLCTYL